MLSNPLNYRAAAQVPADHREVLRESAIRTLSIGLIATRNRDVCIPSNGKDIDPEGTCRLL